MKKLFEQVYGRKLDCFEEIKYSLPLYLQDGKTFYRVSVSGKTFVVVFSETKERFNIKNLKKQLATYQNAIKAEVVYGFDKISSFQRKSMIENEIPFVSCNGQMYLPFMGVLFEKCAKGEDIVKEHFAPGSQVLFLLFLYENDSYTKLEAAKRLQVLPMTISRASKQLLEKGFRIICRFFHQSLGQFTTIWNTHSQESISINTRSQLLLKNCVTLIL